MHKISPSNIFFPLHIYHQSLYSYFLFLSSLLSISACFMAYLESLSLSLLLPNPPPTQHSNTHTHIHTPFSQCVIKKKKETPSSNSGTEREKNGETNQEKESGRKRGEERGKKKKNRQLFNCFLKKWR